MPSNYTPNYNLNQWAASDRVLRVDFNADNTKIDTALAGKASVSSLNTLKTSLDKKADKTALDSLKTLVDSKADKSSLSTLQTTISSQGTELALRNCRFITGTYTGTGKIGSDNPNTITFPYKPVFLHVSSTEHPAYFSAVQGQPHVYGHANSTNSHLYVTWNNRSVSWYVITNSAAGQLNESRTVYYYFAILEVKE